MSRTSSSSGPRGVRSVTTSPTDAFLINACSEREQLIKKAVLANTLLDHAGKPFASWQWNVTPRLSGNHALAIRISARIRDSLGAPVNHTLVPDRTILVAVNINRRQIAMKALAWTGAALTAAVIGAVIQDQVWPVVRDWLFKA